MKLEEMRKIVKEVSERPWSHTHIFDGEEIITHGNDNNQLGVMFNYIDAKFVAMASDKIDKLLDVLETAKEFITKAELEIMYVDMPMHDALQKAIAEAEKNQEEPLKDLMVENMKLNKSTWLQGKIFISFDENAKPVKKSEKE